MVFFFSLLYTNFFPSLVKGESVKDKARGSMGRELFYIFLRVLAVRHWNSVAFYSERGPGSQNLANLKEVVRTRWGHCGNDLF